MESSSERLLGPESWFARFKAALTSFFLSIRTWFGEFFDGIATAWTNLVSFLVEQASAGHDSHMQGMHYMFFAILGLDLALISLRKSSASKEPELISTDVDHYWEMLSVSMTSSFMGLLVATLTLLAPAGGLTQRWSATYSIVLLLCAWTSTSACTCMVMWELLADDHSFQITLVIFGICITLIGMLLAACCCRDVHE